MGLLLDETLEWNVASPAMQIQNKFLKKYGPITWRDTRAIHDVTQKYIDELKIKCTSSKQKARELSGGNQQKVCLAKAFALQPRFLFVSEPTRGIDVGAKALVLDALKKFNRENGVTVVMISSELEELRTTCDPDRHCLWRQDRRHPPGHRILRDVRRADGQPGQIRRKYG